MKYTKFFLIFFLFFYNISLAQNIGSAEDYMTAIANAQIEMNSKYMQYMSTTAHALTDKNIEKFREQVVQSIVNAKQKTEALPAYNGDNSLRQNSIDYIELCYNVFNNDFGQILNMQEIEEQSYNDMQRLLLIQEKAAEKLIQASVAMTKAEINFIEKHHVNVISHRDELTAKLEVARNLNHYRNTIFLIFYKCNWEDDQINKAIEAKKVNDIEQARNALARYAEEGMQTLNAIQNFEGDPSLKDACRETLKFYKSIAEKEIPKLTEFYLQEENYNKIKTDYDANTSRSKSDIAFYNSNVKVYNAALAKYNQANNNILNNRRIVLANWDAVERRFADAHMPHYKEKDAKKAAK